MAIGQLELAFRVVVTLFAIAAPTLLFLGLWRGLDAMRDDELIERARQRAEATDQSPTEADWPLDPLPDSGQSPLTADDSGPVVTCETCGTPNMQDATYCQECLSELDGA
ncbi:hypothetical protein Harman_16340 [Haloarcula mannanilytica]|uniref:DUF7577 domain-containing protein n=1 Tax=Haloarcula mannanilytica TaxID=2509225 RepID=A0A4C2ENB4_9EURY|nr:zinc ribbon domain-containing protein [Haloarcula mannanilytica]GCF13699.1 hypothetical protein Harman_16340 [Haloarcula mannanilytica]